METRKSETSGRSRRVIFKRREAGGAVQSTATFAIFALVIGQIFWGGSYLLSDFALEVFPPAMLVAMRMLIAATILGLIGVSTGAIKPIDKKDIKYFFFAAFMEPFVYFLCEAQALERVSPTIASVMLSFIPLLTPVFAFIAIREKVTFMNVLGIVISVAGVLMIIVKPGGELSADYLGILLLFTAVVASISYTLILRKIPEKYNALTIVFYMFLVSLLYFIPTCIIKEWPRVTAIDFSAERTHQALVAVVGLALTASCIAFLFFSFGVRVLGATRANVFNNIQPGVTALLSWFILDEKLRGVQIWGIVIVVVGMFISQASLTAIVSRIKAIRGKSEDAVPAEEQNVLQDKD